MNKADMTDPGFPGPERAEPKRFEDGTGGVTTPTKGSSFLRDLASFIVYPAVGMALVAALVWLFIIDSPEKRFLSNCADRGGTAVVVGMGSRGSTQYDCVVDGIVVDTRH